MGYEFDDDFGLPDTSLLEQRVRESHRERLDSISLLDEKAKEPVVKPLRRTSRGGAASTPANPGSEPPAPQRDDPDDGEHRDEAPKEAVESKPEPEVEHSETAQEEVAKDVEEEKSTPEETETETVISEEPVETTSVAQRHTVLVSGAATVDRETLEKLASAPKTGFKFDGDTVQMKRFPADVRDHLYSQLIAQGYEDLAGKLSSAAVVTAAAIAFTGASVEGLDESTAAAVAIFQTSNVRLSRMEAQMDRLEAMLEKATKSGEYTLATTRSSAQVLHTLELITEFLLTDRIAPMSNHGISTFNMISAPVLEVRKRARSQSDEMRKSERARAGRPIA